MIASEEERSRIAREVAGEEKVWWMVPGWIKFQDRVFFEWDRRLANENFPKHTGGAIVLDGIGYFDQYAAEHPEELLEYSDWMQIPNRDTQSPWTDSNRFWRSRRENSRLLFLLGCD